MNDLVQWANNLFQGIFGSSLEDHGLLLIGVLLVVMVIKFLNRNFKRFIFLVIIFVIMSAYFFGKPS